MNDYRAEQHRKAGCILVQVTAQRLNLPEHEIFRLAKSKYQGGCSNREAKQDYSEWLAHLERRPLPDFIYDFCLDVLTNRIAPKRAPKKGARNEHR